MIDPIIFTIRLFGREWPVHWYGVIVMLGIVAGSLLIERELKRRGEKSDLIWDALVWVVPIGIVGARLWYVFNATLGDNQSYFENPASIFKVWEGGLHIFGGFLFGAMTLLVYLRLNKLDPWLFLDAAGPAALIGQGIGRLANFINQELYGPPTKLPWGLKIEAAHRLPPYQDLNLFPVETTRFHPTFAYELLWNFITAGILLWLSRRYEKQMKPGTVFAGWSMAAGIGRTWIELFFRPDQPKIDALGISYSAIFAALMAVVGAILLLARYKVLNLKFAENWEEEYQVSTKAEPASEVSEPGESEEFVEEEETPLASKAPAARKTPVRRTTKTPRGTRRSARAKKSS